MPRLLPPVFLCVTDLELAGYLETLLKDSGLSGEIRRCAGVEDIIIDTQRLPLAYVFTTATPSEQLYFDRTLSDRVRFVAVLFDVRWPAIEAATTAGVRSCIYALSGEEEHKHAVRLILTGRIYFPFKSIVSAQSAKRVNRPELTARQTEVLARLCLGETNAQISRKLGISENTVRLHISAVLRAYGARNRTAVVAAANGVGEVSGEIQSRFPHSTDGLSLTY